MKNPHSLRAKCSKCSAFLNFRTHLSDEIEVFKLKSYKVNHQHPIVDKKTKKNAVVSFLRNHR